MFGSTTNSSESPTANEMEVQTAIAIVHRVTATSPAPKARAVFVPAVPSAWAIRPRQDGQEPDEAQARRENEHERDERLVSVARVRVPRDDLGVRVTRIALQSEDHDRPTVRRRGSR